MSKVNKILKEVNVTIESCLYVQPVSNILLEKLGVHTQIEEEDLPSNLSGEILEGTHIVREEVFVSTSEVNRERSHVTMNPPGGGGIPPPIPPIPLFPPIDPQVRPKGLPIVVPQRLAAVDIPSHLPKFYGTKDEDLSRPMERFIERVISSLITNQGYWLVWFPTTLEDEAYDRYRDHDEGHFRTWDQLQRKFLNEFRPEVGQSVVFRALMNMKQ